MIINFRCMQNFNPHYPSFAYAIYRVFVCHCILCGSIARFEILNVVVVVCLSICRFIYTLYRGEKGFGLFLCIPLMIIIVFVV